MASENSSSRDVDGMEGLPSPKLLECPDQLSGPTQG